MAYIERLKNKREDLMDKYIRFVKKATLTESERIDRKRIQQEIINLDYEIEQIDIESNKVKEKFIKN